MLREVYSPVNGERYLAICVSQQNAESNSQPVPAEVFVHVLDLFGGCLFLGYRPRCSAMGSLLQDVGEQECVANVYRDVCCGRGEGVGHDLR